MDPKQHEKVAVGVSAVTIVINLALAGFKFLAGFLARSGAMISDAVHSASVRSLFLPFDFSFINILFVYSLLQR